MSTLTVTTNIKARISDIRAYRTQPEHIMVWNHASDDRYCPSVDNELYVNGRFSCTMATKDGSASFDYKGRYTNIITNTLLEYTIEPNREVSILFENKWDHIAITETFETDTAHSAEFQQARRQSILNNFKRYAEQK
jgi:uncharacterized protein YndB with AHSA1/START domain